MLKGDGTRDQDFWPDLIIEFDGGGSMHQARAATRTPIVEIPTLDTFGLAAMVLLMMAAMIRMMRRTS